MNLSTGNGIRIGRGMAAIVAALALAFVALAQAVTTTTVQGTVYFANGQPGSGTVQIQWPSFTTAGGQAIAAGSTTVTIGSDGFLSVNLAPNQDATPAGLFYTVTYYLSNGSTNTEYWVVPDAAQATLAQVRATVMPSSQAIQTVSKAYVDQAIANLSQGGLSPSGGTLTGPLYLAGDPTSSLQAADKHYVDTSVSQSVPLSGGTLSGPLSGPSVNASVNNVLNVMAAPYNAKGDCVTDDHDAIQAALTAAQANASSNTVVYFPTPPGGCYLTSQLNWYGVSLRGEAGNNQNGQTWQGVTLKGQPGQDILHTGDPDSTATVPTRLWSLENISFLLDDSVYASGSSGNFSHRWPGKWVGDGAMTSGSATLTSTYAEFTCGDIGQAVLVKGAGAAGADLSTTISSVSPCYGGIPPTTATLAASASTTVSAARVYIAVAGMPATQQIGNCAIALDNSDGNSANWTGSATRLPLYDNLHNVNFSTTSGAMQGQNNSCAVYFQGAYIPYGLDARNVNITRFTYGVVEGMSDVNPVGAAGNNVGIGQDYQLWDHGDWVSKYPWISYNGGQNEIRGVELYATAGPQLLQVKSPSETSGSRWKIEAPEFEQPSGAVSGWRIDLDLNTLINTQLASVAANIPAYIEGYGNLCIGCTGAQTLNVAGYGNHLQLTYGEATVNDAGYGNTVSTVTNSSGYAGQTPTRPVAQNATRGSEPWGRLSADFIRTGNVSTPYMNLEDLLIQPADVRWLSGYGTVVYPDATSITGKYGYTNGVYTVMGFANPSASALTGNAYNYVIGGVGAGKANVPATKVTLYASVKCPSVTSYTLTVRAGSTTVASATPTCNSSGYTVGSVTADLSSYAGQNFGFQIGSGSGEVDWAYVAVRPFQADYNGYQPAHAGSNADITSLSGLTTPLTTAQGGTGSAGVTGLRYGNGSSPDTSATASQVNTLLQDLTNCTTAGYVYSPQSGSCVAQGGGGGGSYAGVTSNGANGLTISGQPGNATDATTIAAVEEIARNAGNQKCTWAVDSVNGLDTNTGQCTVSGSVQTCSPFQTLTKLQTETFNPGDVVCLANGSHWRQAATGDMLSIGAAHITLENYSGTTNSSVRPIVDGMSIIPNASFGVASGACYQATSLPIDTPTGATQVRAYENGKLLTLETSVANCAANPGSFYVSSSSSTPITVYVNPVGSTNPTTDGNTYEYTQHANVVNLTGDYSRIIGIIGRGSMYNDGPLRMSGRYALAINDLAENSFQHGIYFAGGGIGYNDETYDVGNGFIWYESSGNNWNAACFYCSFRTPIIDYSGGSAGFYMHTGDTSTWAQLLLVDPVVINAANAVGASANFIKIVNPFFYTGNTSVGWGATEEIDGGTIQALTNQAVAGGGTGGVLTVNGTKIIASPIMVNGGITGNTVNLNGVQFTQIAAGDYLVDSGSSNTWNIHNSTFGPAADRLFSFPTSDTISSNNNTFTEMQPTIYNGTTYTQPRFVLGATTETWTAWQALGYDVNSTLSTCALGQLPCIYSASGSLMVSSGSFTTGSTSATIDTPPSGFSSGNSPVTTEYRACAWLSQGGYGQSGTASISFNGYYNGTTGTYTSTIVSQTYTGTAARSQACGLFPDYPGQPITLTFANSNSSEGMSYGYSIERVQ